jgi:hypothetical protein
MSGETCGIPLPCAGSPSRGVMAEASLKGVGKGRFHSTFDSRSHS